MMNNEGMSAEGVRWPDDKQVFLRAWDCYKEDWPLLLTASGAAALITAIAVSFEDRLGSLGYGVLLAAMLVAEIGLYKICWDIWHRGKTQLRELFCVYRQPRLWASAVLWCFLLMAAQAGTEKLAHWLDFLGGTFVQGVWGQRLVWLLFALFWWYLYFRLFPARYLLVSGQTTKPWLLLQQSWQITKGQGFDIFGYYWGIFWRTFLVSLPLVFWADPFTVPVVYHFLYDLLIVPYVFLAHVGFAEELARFAEEKRG